MAILLFVVVMTTGNWEAPRKPRTTYFWAVFFNTLWKSEFRDWWKFRSYSQVIIVAVDGFFVYCITHQCTTMTIVLFRGLHIGFHVFLKMD